MNLGSRRRWHLVERPLEIDRISALPDDVLLRIISCLPVVQWASLSAVSRSWRRLFSLLPHHPLVELHFPDPHSPLPKGAFPRALLRLCHIVCRSDLSWETQLELLQDAKDVCVRELIFQNVTSADWDYDIEIHEFVLSIKSLTRLTLVGCSLTCDGLLMSADVTIGCKHLKILHIEDSFTTPFALELILARCLVLETLVLAYPVELSDARICSRSLKRLLLILRGSIFCIDVDAPQLEILNLEKRDEPHEWYELKIRAPKTQKVLFDFGNPSPSSLPPLRMKGFLRTAQDLRSMKLSGAAVQILAKECWEPKLGFSFKELTSLTISLDMVRRSQAYFLVKLLEVCPSISQLNLNLLKVSQVQPASNAFPKHMFDRLKKSACLSHQLKELNVLLLRLECELKLVNFFMAEAKGLKKMTLHLPAHVKMEIRDMLPLNYSISMKTYDDHPGMKVIEMTL